MSLQVLSTIVLALLLGLLCGRAVAASGDWAEMERLKNAAFETESKGLWKKIDWSEEADDALARAEKSGKPIFLFMLVGKMGKKNAGEC